EGHVGEPQLTLARGVEVDVEAEREPGARGAELGGVSDQPGEQREGCRPPPAETHHGREEVDREEDEDVGPEEERPREEVEKTHAVSAPAGACRRRAARRASSPSPRGPSRRATPA